MDKRFIPVAMLAGALALAGCGGGSDTPAASSANGANGANGTNPGTTANGGYVTVDATQVPGGYDLTDADEDDKGQIRSGGKGIWPGMDGTRLEVTCNDDDGCLWRVRNGQIQVTGDFEAERIDPPVPEVVGDGNTHGNVDSESWLSNNALVRAVKSDGKLEVIRNHVPLTVITAANANGGVFSNGMADRPADGSVTTDPAIGTVTVDAGGGFETHLRLSHTRNRTNNGPDQALVNEYLVYGAWETRTDSGNRPGGGDESDDLDPVEPPQADAVWWGSIPRTDPEAWGTGSAQYVGKVLGHYKAASGTIKSKDPWTEFVADADLRANFAPQQRNIRGRILSDIGTPSTPIVPSSGALAGVTRIDLEQVKIGASMRGDTAIGGTGNTGKWNAGFFGTAVGGEPGGIAGDFAGQRPSSPSQQAIQIQGAFGAHNVDDLQ